MLLRNLHDDHWYFALTANSDCGKIPCASGKDIKRHSSSRMFQYLKSEYETLPRGYYPVVVNETKIIAIRPIDKGEIAELAVNEIRPNWNSSAVGIIKDPVYEFIPKPGTMPKKKRTAAAVSHIEDDLDDEASQVFDLVLSGARIFSRTLAGS